MLKLIIFHNLVFDIYVDDSTEIGFIRNSTRQFLLQALLKSLDQPAPNLAHLLLGFDIRKSVSKTLLQDPGKCVKQWIDIMIIYTFINFILCQFLKMMFECMYSFSFETLESTSFFIFFTQFLIDLK